MQGLLSTITVTDVRPLVISSSSHRKIIQTAARSFSNCGNFKHDHSSPSNSCAERWMFRHKKLCNLCQTGSVSCTYRIWWHVSLYLYASQLQRMLKPPSLPSVAPVTSILIVAAATPPPAPFHIRRPKTRQTCTVPSSLAGRRSATPIWKSPSDATTLLSSPGCATPNDVSSIVDRAAFSDLYIHRCCRISRRTSSRTGSQIASTVGGGDMALCSLQTAAGRGAMERGCGRRCCGRRCYPVAALQIS